MNLVQSAAIVKYLGRKFKLVGSNENELVKIEQLYDGARDFYMNFAAFGFTDEAERKVIVQQKMDKYLPIFDKVLAENSSGYLVGSSLTLADLALFEVLEASTDYFGKDNFKAYPAVVKFYTTVTALPNIQKYLKEIRKGVNTPPYIAHVKKVLEMP